MDINQAIQTALKKRPEFDLENLQLDIDDINIRLAHNQMQPDLELEETAPWRWTRTRSSV